MRVCSTPGCPNLIPKPGRCAEHARQADRARGTATERGYTSKGHRTFRQAVLTRNPVCVLCPSIATVADHHPRSRRELELAGLDPNDPQYGRGLCQPCHSRETARHQPGGWANQQNAQA